MHYNRRTSALLAVGVISLAAIAHAEEGATPVLATLSSTTISGYVDTSAQWNFGTGNAGVPAYSFGGPAKADGFNLNVVKLTLEKPAEGGDAWNAGYKVDLLFGPDANALATTSVAGANTSDFGIKQAYVALHAPIGNGLDFKVGVWDTVLGYEVFESVNNPNFTRSYGYTIEPTTHTGIHANYQFCEAFSASVCVVNTFGSAINGRANPPKAESYKAYMGMLAFTAPKDWGWVAGSTLTACVLNGFNIGANGGAADQTSYYIGGTLNTPVTGLKVGAAYDYAGVSRQPSAAGPVGPAYANAAAIYASYQATEKLSLHARGEYAWSNPAFLGARKVLAATGTLQYDLWKNVLSRLEFRWDHAADGTTPFGGTIGGPTTKKNSFILLANIAYKF